MRGIQDRVRGQQRRLIEAMSTNKFAYAMTMMGILGTWKASADKSNAGKHDGGGLLDALQVDG